MKLSLPTQVLEYKFNLPTKTLHHQVLQGKFNLHQNLAPLTYTKTWHQVLGEKSKFWHRQDLEGKFTQHDNLKLGLSKFWSCLGGGARRLVHNRLKPPSVELSLHSEHILFQMCYSLVWPRWLIRWLVFTLRLTYSHVDWCSLTSLHFTPPDFIASWKFKLFPQYLVYAYCICRCLLLNSWTRKARSHRKGNFLGLTGKTVVSKSVGVRNLWWPRAPGAGSTVLTSWWCFHRDVEPGHSFLG